MTVLRNANRQFKPPNSVNEGFTVQKCLFSLTPAGYRKNSANLYMQRAQRFPVNMVIGHILFWLAYIYYQGIIYHWQDTDDLIFTLNFHEGTFPVIVTILLTYFNLYALLPWFYYRQKYVRYALALIVSLFAGALLTRFIAHQFIIPWERMNDPIRYAKEIKQFWIPSRIIRLAIQYYPAIAIVTLFELMHRANLQEKQLRNAERERSAAELNFLKAQINPHFFFNTLNSLYALILQGSGEAAKLVMRLSELMRYMLEQTKADRVDLAAEISELENYVRIEQLRFEDRLDLSFTYSGDIQGQVIMPLTLLPFAENAFKHGVENGQAWVAVDIKVTGKLLFYSVMNNKPAEQPTKGTGIGLENLRRRLELTYPGRYTITIKDLPDVFEAVLKIEL